jgi:peptide/nickel transport system substrate-binding protein
MMGFVDRRSGRIVAAAVAAGFALSACDANPRPSGAVEATSQPTMQPTDAPSPSPAGRTGGTIYLLTQAEQLNHIDPQRMYTGEDVAFLGATIYRSLETYDLSPDPVEGSTLVPDLATDLGTASDGGRTWSFTLRDGVTFQTGDPITCEDVRYGVSRTFANNVISEGPTYAVQYLDVPPANDADTEKGYLSSYYGPYDSTPEQQARFERAVECSPDHRTITFHLNRPVADFNYTTTLGFFPVPKAADTGETYGTTKDSLPVSSGPYMVESYTTGQGGRLVLVRNPSWSRTSDPVRGAYPDSWVVEFAVEPKDIADRLVASTGDDAFAISYSSFDEETVRSLFADGTRPVPELVGRALAEFDPYSRYFWIDVRKVPNLKVRQAMLVALDREAIRDVYGGELYGSYADGVIKPTIGQDYAPTGIWDTFFGKAIPPSGDPELARRLIAESGVKSPKLMISLYDTPTNMAVVAIVIESLGKAGIEVEYKPPSCRPGMYCSIVFDPNKGADLGTGGWGADWANASTVIPPVFTQAGGWDLSQVDDPAFNAAVEDAFATLDRAEQARKWQALNRQAVENAWVIPTVFGRWYRLAGTNVGPVYQWPAFSSWPYAEMRITP